MLKLKMYIVHITYEFQRQQNLLVSGKNHRLTSDSNSSHCLRPQIFAFLVCCLLRHHKSSLSSVVLGEHNRESFEAGLLIEDK